MKIILRQGEEIEILLESDEGQIAPFLLIELTPEGHAALGFTEESEKLLLEVILPQILADRRARLQSDGFHKPLN